jgi:hypothetical protein
MVTVVSRLSQVVTDNESDMLASTSMTAPP